MLFLLLKYSYIAILSFIYGIGGIETLQKVFPIKEKSSLSIPLTMIVGIAVITCIVSWLSFIIPIAGTANLFVLMLGGIIGWRYSTEIYNQIQEARKGISKVSWWQKSIFLYGVLYILFLSVQQTVSMDEGTYHAQSILWSETYPIVKGLSNPLTKLGFNNHWHLTSALFNWSFWTGQESNQINGVFYLMMLAFCLQGFGDSLPKFGRLLRLGLLVLMHYSPLHVFHIIAPSADVVVIYSCWIIFVLLVDKMMENTFWEVDKRSLFILVISCFLLTVKLSSLPILLACFPALWAFLKRKQFAPIFSFVGIGTLFMSAWLARNVLLTGYLIYPFEAIDIFNFDWKVSLEQVQKEAKWIHDAAFLLAKSDHNNAVMQMPYFQKLGVWFTDNLHLNDRLLMMALMVSPFLQIAFYFNKKMPFYRKKEFLLLCGMLWAGILFWLLQAPNPRFGYGFTLFTFVFSFIPIALYLPFKKNHLIALSIIGIIGFQGVTYAYYQKKINWFITKKWMEKSEPKYSILLMPKPYPNVNTTNENGFNYTDKKCWDMPLPCINKIRENVVLRGQKIEEGFRTEDSSTDLLK